MGQTARLASRQASHGRKTIDPRSLGDDLPPVHVLGGVYQEMHVIFRTYLDATMREVEAQLEAWSRTYFAGQGRWGLGAANLAGGGAGRRTTGPYCIYVLRGLRGPDEEYRGPGYRRPQPA